MVTATWAFSASLPVHSWIQLPASCQLHPAICWCGRHQQQSGQPEARFMLIDCSGSMATTVMWPV